MKTYKVKIGKFYIDDIEVNNRKTNTNFIERIVLYAEPDNYGFEIKENEQEKIRELLCEVLDLENVFNEVTFEKVGDTNE